VLGELELTARFFKWGFEYRLLDYDLGHTTPGDDPLSFPLGYRKMR
jgi:hypothetical protein